jgi:hypothetical protein
MRDVLALFIRLIAFDSKVARASWSTPSNTETDRFPAKTALGAFRRRSFR